MSDLFNAKPIKQDKSSYTAKDIEVLEGLEPVRRRPGMYIGGTDENALHHLVSEVLDNSMDEAVAGHASKISITMHANGSITIEDNGRGIPVDPHPKYPDKSALEVILTTLHSGGKFSNKAYQTAGGLHGVGISVVNALSEQFKAEVIRDKVLYRQTYSKGMLLGIEQEQAPYNKKGTSITFSHDTEIFGNHLKLKSRRVYELAKSKAYLYKGIEIKWNCATEVLQDGVPESDILHFPGGLTDYLKSKLGDDEYVLTSVFSGEINAASDGTKVSWAMSWHDDDGFVQSYCNTILTPLGGTHEQGMRSALLRSIKNYGEMVGNKRATGIVIDDILSGGCIVLSIFIPEPLFQGQTKEKLASANAVRLVDNIIKDRFDHWLTGDKVSANKLLEHVLKKADERLNKKSEKAVNRKSVVQKLRLPGKLADCTRDIQTGTELFIVEGDSAGGSAKQARNRETQAILPLRGKILNVANSTSDKINQNQEIKDLEIALACGSLGNYKSSDLRYEKIIIMTDADVDGAHIAALLMTFFYIRMPKLIADGHLYIAQPPLYRITQNVKTYYAASDIQKEKIIAELNKKSKSKIEIGRFKGLGEMTAPQLKETTMNPQNRVITRITIDDFNNVSKIVDDLMGKKPEKRFQFIYEQALVKIDKIVEQLDF